MSGFGINNVNQVQEVCEICDGAVVASSIIKIIENNLDNSDRAISIIAEFVRSLKEGINQ